MSKANIPMPKEVPAQRDVTFRLRLTADERERLDEMAAEAGMTASQYARKQIFG